MRHPVVGTVTVTQQTLALARSPGQAVVVCTTPAGSPSEEAPALLRQVGAGERGDPAGRVDRPGRMSAYG